jgi:hypothetical protein
VRITLTPLGQATTAVIALVCLLYMLPVAGERLALPPVPGRVGGADPQPTESPCPQTPAPAPVLTVQPDRGGLRTTIVASGVGFVRNGRVKLRFHSHEMGWADTDCAGRFSVELSIPNQEFYGHFLGTQFAIGTTEYAGHGHYTGNGDDAPFMLTRS